MPVYTQSSARGTAMDLSDSDSEDDEMMQNGEGDEEDEDLSQFTVDTFESRPMGGETAINTLRSMHTKMAEPLNRIDETLRLFGEVAAAIADCDEKHHMIRRVQSDFLSTLETRYQIQIKVDVLKMLELRLRNGDAIDRIEEQYNQECEAKFAEWSSKSERMKYKTDKHFEQFRTMIWEKNHPDQPLGPIAFYLEKDENDESGSDDEVEAGGTVRNYQCPLTRKTLKDAHTSDLCGHSYTGQYIMEMLNTNKRKGIKCPMAGCGHQLLPKDVHPDPALQKQADAHVKKQEQRKRETDRAHDDEEEVVDDSDQE